MRVVVTGGGGYVGYHVGWALSRGGHHVILLDVTPPDPEWMITAPRALWDALPLGFWGGKDLPQPGLLEFVEGSITNPQDLERHFEGAAAVVHTASYGMSGKEQLSPHAPQQEKVNIEGTREVIRAALTAKVRALVYTSTYNVVFGGCEIKEGDETLPLFPLHAHTDHYSRTKAIAEMLVLMADGKCGLPAASSTAPQPCLSPLRTCSLRMNGVMGLGEKRHSQRIISAIRSGLLIFAYGRKNGLIDFIGIQNVVQAHVKALMALLKEQILSTEDIPTILSASSKILGCGGKQHTLTSAGDSSSPSAVSSAFPISAKSHTVISSSVTSSLPEIVSTSKGELISTISSGPSSVVLSSPVSLSSSTTSPSIPPPVSGQAFFISDSAPVSHFEYFRPLFEGLGYSFPALTLPLWVILAVAYLEEFIYCLVYRFYPFSPFVTPAEAYKSGVTHYCSSHKAMDAFSYSPTRPNDLKQITEYYKAQGCTRTDKMGIVSILPLALFFILPVCILLIVI